jgi:hypothetical protein
MVAGVRVAGALLDRIEEITSADIRRGGKSIEGVLAAASARMTADYERTLDRSDRKLCDAPRWYHQTKHCTLLVTGPQLLAEGRLLRHCVAGYAPLVSGGHCVILAVRCHGQASTVELTRGGQVQQHRGPGNADPNPWCVAALNRAMRAWRLPWRGAL